MNPKDFIHPEDAAALEQLERVPGLSALIKKALSLGLENLQYGINMASTVRLSEHQLPQYYNRLPPICERLGIEVPELYLLNDPIPNAWTFGDTRVYITVTSGLIDMMSAEELDAVLAHECGHILCRHVLYHSIATYIMKGMDILGILGVLALPLKYAILHWDRMSELSADRAACIVTSPETVASVMCRLSGGPQSITKDINLDLWAKQADEYDVIKNENLWSKTLQLMVIMEQMHPFAAVRVREILKWSRSEDYQMIFNKANAISSSVPCHYCGKSVFNDWHYCRHCGNPLSQRLQ